MRLKLRSHRLSALRRKLYDSFVEVTPVAGGRAGDAVTSLGTRLPAGFGPVAAFTPSGTTSVSASGYWPGLDVRAGGRLSGEEIEQIGTQVDAFFTEHPSPEDGALYGRSERARWRSGALVGVALLGSVVHQLMAEPTPGGCSPTGRSWRSS
ncbi:hypothetical protein [Nonomuraea sp. NPDC050783]|uniref:hypothetical protein n=1 Tax=Nonomuraea sp. NPDC050783 TaxID=3154634 RepID=UPI0034652A48